MGAADMARGVGRGLEVSWGLGTVRVMVVVEAKYYFK